MQRDSSLNRGTKWRISPCHVLPLRCEVVVLLSHSFLLSLTYYAFVAVLSSREIFRRDTSWRNDTERTYNVKWHLKAIQRTKIEYRKKFFWTSLAVQRLRLYTPTSGDTGLIPGWEKKFPHAGWCRKKIKLFFRKRKNKEKIFTSPVIVKWRKFKNLPHPLIKVNKVGISTESVRKWALSFAVSGIVNWTNVSGRQLNKLTYGIYLKVKLGYKKKATSLIEHIEVN